MNKKLLVSSIANFLIFIIAFVCFFVGASTPADPENTILRYGYGIIIYFTVQSNLLAGLVALVFAIFEVRVLMKKANAIPDILYVLKHVVAVGVGVTFLTVVLYLAPINSKGYFDLFTGINFFYHFLLPVGAIVLLLTTDRRRIPFKFTFIGLIHMFLYGVFYVINAFTHLENGAVVPYHDWYFLLQGGTLFCFISVTLMLSMNYLISFLLWLPNRKYSR